MSPLIFNLCIKNKSTVGIQTQGQKKSYASGTRYLQIVTENCNMRMNKKKKEFLVLSLKSK